MASFNLVGFNLALNEPAQEPSGVDFSDKKSKLNTFEDAKELVTAINNCSEMQFLRLTGNTVGVEAAGAIATALEGHPEFKMAWWSDMFTGRMKTEIPLALRALGNSMITAGARLTVLDLSDNAFGPIGVEGLAELLASSVCCQLQELRLNNNGLGITGGRMLAKALLGSNSGSPPRLKVFIAGRNRLENDGAIALADVFKKMGSLEHVAMPQNGIYHVGISALSTAFSSNPGLRILNLNDNTIGPKGATAVAAVLPHLKNIVDVNFGDCLLKSAGAVVLAEAFEKNGVKLERLDLSDNEMSGEACVRVAQAVASAGGAHAVVLRGNRVSAAVTRSRLRDLLGEDVVVLKEEDAGSDEETGDETDEESDDADEEEDNEDAEDEPSETDTSTENGVDLEVVQKVISVVLDESGVEEVKTDVSRFLDEPTLENFRLLGDNAADVIDTHLQSIKQCSDLMCAYVEAVMKVSGLCGGSNVDTRVANQARALYERLVARSRKEHAAQWALANAMLVALGLLKSETKKTKIAWNLDGCYSILSSVIAQPYFPVNLRETIRFFVKNRKSGHIGDADFTLGSYPNLV